MSASPVLASQAAKVKRIIGVVINVVEIRFIESVVSIRNRVSAMFSTHNRAEIKCVR